LLDDENPFPDGDPMPWFGPLYSAMSYFLDLHPECVAKRNRVCLCLLLRVMLFIRQRQLAHALTYLFVLGMPMMFHFDYWYCDRSACARSIFVRIE
jgi:hypothetical protein